MSEDVQSGSIVLGQWHSRLRNGSRTLVLKWEAVRRPYRVCEGGGWYSRHPTETAWVFRSWMEHKTAPGWPWPATASEHDSDLDALIERALSMALVRYGFAPASAIEARRAETQSGSVHESAAPERRTPESLSQDHPHD